MRTLGRIVRVAQWFPLGLIPLWVVGSVNGWEWFFAIPVALADLVGLLVLCLVSTLRPGLRGSGTLPGAYMVLVIVLWVAQAAFPLTLRATDDISTEPSPLERIGVPESVDSALIGLLLAAGVLLWLAALLTVTLSKPPLPEPRPAESSTTAAG